MDIKDSKSEEQKKKTDQKPEIPQSPWRSWPLLLALVVAWIFLLQGFGTEYPSISYSKFKSELKSGNIKRVEAKGETITGEFKKPIEIQVPAGLTGEETKKQKIERFETTTPPFGDEKLTDQLISQDIEFVSKGSAEGGFWIVLANLLPFLLLIGIGILIMRRATQQAGGMMSIGRSKAKKFEKEHTSVTFEDVAGLKEAKEGLKEIISFLREPDRYTRLGCRVPKGVLLVGPPGSGKTLLARSVAGEAECPFYSITGSDFMEMFVGVGASRVRDLFKTAKQNTPCIIFLDELDSVGRHRGAGLGGGHDEREQTLNQLLSEIDGFEPTDNLVVMAATNRPDILDPALLRPGRFDRRVTVDLPSVHERAEILKVHARKVPLKDDVDLEEIARSMPGRSGADLSNLVNEAALMAAKEGKEKVGKEDFSRARDQILMGQQRSGIVLRGREKHAIAVHEAGHALVAHLEPEADPVEKVSIIPRGRGLGATQQLPEERYNFTADYLRARLKVMLSGRASESAVLGSISTGAADDLSQATRLARRMVSQWGMSEKFHHVAFQDGDTDVFLGEQIAQQREYSEETAREIDLEVKDLIDECYKGALNILQENQDRLKHIAEVLEEEETLEGEQLKNLLDGNEKE